MHIRQSSQSKPSQRHPNPNPLTHPIFGSLSISFSPARQSSALYSPFANSKPFEIPLKHDSISINYSSQSKTHRPRNRKHLTHLAPDNTPHFTSPTPRAQTEQSKHHPYFVHISIYPPHSSKLEAPHFNFQMK